MGEVVQLTVRVGITCNRVGSENRLSQAYVGAVAKTGAVPLLIPVCGTPRLWRKTAEAADALLLSGGGDPDAVHYGEEAMPAQGYVQPERDGMEIYLARYALQTGMPVLGICRGAQIMAIAAGGKLWQDLAGIEKIQHDQRAPRNYPIHRVTVREGSLLFRITGKKVLRVNSLHHQAIRFPGRGMSVSAAAADGIIEAVEMPGHPFALGVQWHPEWLCRKFSHAAALFAALYRAAKQRKKENSGKKTLW